MIIYENNACKRFILGSKTKFHGATAKLVLNGRQVFRLTQMSSLVRGDDARGAT